MHESPIARQLVAAAEREALAAGSSRVTRMDIRLGPEGAYVPDSLRVHIQAAAAGTAVEDAEVEITSVLTGGAELVSIDVEESA